MLQEKKNFAWEDVDVENLDTKNAFVDKIVEQTELNDMNVVLPEAYKTTLEKESFKQMLMIKIDTLINSFKTK